MSEKIFQVSGSDEFFEIEEVAAHEISLHEKDIENWFSQHTQLIFSDKESVFIVAQERSGERMADILALDSQGNLIIIELKRNWADRTTVGQVIDYASELSGWTYSQFNKRYREYKLDKSELIEEFRAFVDNNEFDEDKLCSKQRLFVVAPYCDENLIRIIEWLKQYELPIDYIPFRIYRKNDTTLIKVKQIEIEPIGYKWEWKRDWFFNTNETHAKGAYDKMIKNSCIAVYGYSNSEAILSAPSTGDRVFFYRNGVGIIAAAEIDDEILSSNDIFGQQDDNEHLRKVKNLLYLEDGIPASKVAKYGYNLPVRSTLCKIYNSRVADLIYDEIKKTLKC